MLVHKTNLNKFKKIKTITSIFSYHNGKKIEINYKKETGKLVETKQHATEQTMVNKEIKSGIKKS